MGLAWGSLGWLGFAWVGLVWVGLCQLGLPSFGLGWCGLSRVGFGVLGLVGVGGLERYAWARIGLDWRVGVGLACIFAGVLRLAYVVFDRLFWIGLGCSGLTSVGLEAWMRVGFLC